MVLTIGHYALGWVLLRLTGYYAWNLIGQ